MICTEHLVAKERKGDLKSISLRQKSYSKSLNSNKLLLRVLKKFETKTIIKWWRLQAI